MRGHGATVWALCAGHGGLTLISGAADNTIRFWEPAADVLIRSSDGRDVADWSVGMRMGGVGGGGSGGGIEASASEPYADMQMNGRYEDGGSSLLTDQPVPLAESRPGHSVVGELVRLTVRYALRRVFRGVWWPAAHWSETEWHDLFGAECTIRHPVSSLIRAWGEILALQRLFGRPYYRRR